MRKLLLFAVLLSWMAALYAQEKPCDEIRKNILCSASNYMAYPGPKQRELTPAPDGRHPFYISHYGRHGSRYHNKPSIYDTPYRILASADSAGKLTPLGQDALRRLRMVRDDASGRWGELTELGALQHRQIIRRMVERFPEPFEGHADVDARSTTVTRCILSMENALVELTRLNPDLNIHHNATQRDMWYLNQQDKRLFAMKMDSATQATYDRFAKQYEQNDRLIQSLFNDTAYVRRHVDAGQLNYFIFKVASNIQSTEIRKQVSLYDLFTDEEVYRNWKKENAWWYIAFGGSTINGGQQPYTQRNLLRRLISDADSCLQLRHTSVQLRFGHETIIMPLTCLLELDGYGIATDDLEHLADRGWANYRIFPMASNIQFIFYRRNDHDRDVVFKVLLNENEATLPLRSNMAPYYHWSDFKDYYLRKLDAAGYPDTKK